MPVASKCDSCSKGHCDMTQDDMTQDEAKIFARRRKTAKRRIVMVFFAAAIALLVGTVYLANLSYAEKERHKTLARKILLAQKQRVQLQRKLKEWNEKLANTPESHFSPIKQSGPLGIAFIRDAAEDFSINITDVQYTAARASGANRKSSADDIGNIAINYNRAKNVPIRAIRIQYRTSWQSLDDLVGWLNALRSYGIITENLKLKANYAEIECSIIGT